MAQAFKLHDGRDEQPAWHHNVVKQPYCFEVGEGDLFAFAGIWERWKDPSGDDVESCSILTTAANAVDAPVHDRMPVIIDHDISMARSRNQRRGGV